MAFASRMTRCPDPFEPERGAEARACLPDLSGQVADLIDGAGGCSPYLKGLIEAEHDWLAEALDDPEAAVETLLAALPEVAPDKMASQLRVAKRRIALLTALADLGGVWPLETVTGTLTRFADTAVALALRTTVGAEIRRGKLPGAGPEDAETAGGIVALAMGKMGAFELNYSSDIDLICLFDETRFERDTYDEARASLVRATRRMATMLSDQTAEGYVFRTDLRLRPDPSVTPVCMAMARAEAYYESLGRTWERAAYIKARPAAGDIAAGERFLDTIKPFVWRKHLDFAAIQDAHDMRLRIREHKGLGGPITLPEHDMKLGRGGIREIEFFTQTRQIIAGGRDRDLRVRGTEAGLEVLAQKGWIPEDVADALTRHYRAHREVEHRLQMLRDAQTHALPATGEGFARLAAFMGQPVADLESDLMARLQEVHEMIEGFFAPESAASRPGPETGDLDTSIIERWYGYPALRSSRAVEIFERLKPDLLSRLTRTARPDEALLALDGFLSRLPAGVQLFSLFEANPQLIDLLIDIVGTSPALAGHLSANAEVFDAVIGGDFFAPWPGEEQLRNDLGAVLDAVEDYERKLDAARRWAREWHFRIGVHHLRGLIDAGRAGRQYADLAGAVLATLWPVVTAQFAIRHGPPPGRGAAIMGMGSLGASRLTASSDLDLILIYDAGGVEKSDGRRPLDARQYYARLTKALVTALSAPMSEGKLYEVDMRLRPSGTQGPVATALDSFRDYQMTQAWVWEHLALTRARAVAGEGALADDVEEVRSAVLRLDRPRDKVLAEAAAMRARIRAAKSPAGPWDAKIGPGRLQDIELVAQAGALLDGSFSRDTLDGLRGAVACGWLDDADGEALCDAYGLCWAVQSVSRLLSDKPLDTEAIGEGGRAMLLRETDCEDLDALSAALAARSGQAARIIDRALPERAQEESR
ncbi:glutamine-synthetase adenylyltransferase [Sediminimonas sp.]|uniref:[protein-PII] uridylyltransferase family protein n=1 Tax=Sediminimonas sp. TaxID=2823379 RepID=UPI0025E70C85|nr:glutamine-synthetase adenylyltransferase [Sediminimonas sp.]